MLHLATKACGNVMRHAVSCCRPPAPMGVPSIVRPAVLPPDCTHAQRQFRTSQVVHMGRRSAKIANRKVLQRTRLRSCSSQWLTLCLVLPGPVLAGQSRCHQGQGVRQDWKEDCAAVSGGARQTQQQQQWEQPGPAVCTTSAAIPQLQTSTLQCSNSTLAVADTVHAC